MSDGEKKSWAETEWAKALEEITTVSDAELADMWEAVQGDEDAVYEMVAAEVARRQAAS